MVIWRGWGAVIFFQFFFWALFVGLVPLMMIHTGPSETPADVMNKWVSDKQSEDLWLAGTCLLSAITCWLMFRYRIAHPRRIADTATGETTIVPRIDDLWYIDLKHWSWIFLVLGLIWVILTLANIALF